MIGKRIFLLSIAVLLGFTLLVFFDITGPTMLPGSELTARLALAATPAPNKIYLPLVLKNSIPPNPLWRFGSAKVRRPFTDYVLTDVTAMRFGWYVDFGTTNNATLPYSIEYVPTIRLKQTKLQGSTPTNGPCAGCPYVIPYTYTVSLPSSTIQSMAVNRPGMTWLIGNEMERRDWAGGGQDEILPEVYAQAYHEIYSAIKGVDPSAKVAIGGMIQATPLRLKYLDRVWSGYNQTYGQAMPVDVWNIHGFVLQEKSCQYYADCYGAEIPAGLTETVGITYPGDTTYSYNKNFSILATNINALRTWMQSHGQQNKPLIISEYSVLYPDWVAPGNFTPTQVRDSFMYPSFDYFLNHTDVSLGYPADGYRVVQRWNWYSNDDDSGCYCSYSGAGSYDQYFNGNLFYSGFGGNAQGIAPLGNYWRQYVQSLPPGSNPPY